MVDGVKEHKKRGTPQGAVISPFLANIYLHYALDSWFDTCRQGMKHKMSMVRYADDFVVTVQRKDDAERFLYAVKQRLTQFSLELHSEKTRVLEFGRFAVRNRRRRGQKKPSALTCTVGFVRRGLG